MQNFSSKDSAETHFWDERFETAFTPWDKGGVPQALQDFVRAAEAPLVTLIPGCGNGYEAAFFAQANWDVTAIDFSPVAVRSAQAAIGVWSKHVLEADFFQFNPARPLQLIYERAFFCALPPRLRKDIVQRWASLLAEGGLLAGYFFFEDVPNVTSATSVTSAAKAATPSTSQDTKPKGPPFSIQRQAWQELISPYFSLVEDCDVSDSIDVFKGKERWQIWRRLPVSVT